MKKRNLEKGELGFISILGIFSLICLIASFKIFAKAPTLNGEGTVPLIMTVIIFFEMRGCPRGFEKGTAPGQKAKEVFQFLFPGQVGIITVYCLVYAVLLGLVGFAVSTFAPRDYFLLAVMGLLLAGSLGNESAARGVMSAAIGIFIGFIGLDSQTGHLRFVIGPSGSSFRTKKEGGEKEIDMETYTALNKAVAESGNVDAVDVEIFSGDDVVRENLANIHAAGKIVVGSNHDFDKTPDYDDLIYRLRKMQDMGADIPKIAVMPKYHKDVLTLLSATETMSSTYADRPIITMSMSATGVISRLCGEVFGSSMTFGAVGQVSAPGQIPVEQLNQAAPIVHNSL